jgi:uncharacterized iron-regulated membrane protein
MTFRKSVFWVHLAAGLIAGLVVAIMSFTGTALAFEKEIIARLERDALHVTPPGTDAPRLPVSELVKNAREQVPDTRPSGITVSSDPTQVVQVAFGRDTAYYANPYTGVVQEQGAKKWRAFFHAMEDWHRYLGRSGDQRAIGKAITGACNAAFLFLVLSGLFLWWPRKWRTKGLRRSVWFLRDATGRARDWNWHNVIGLWSAPILIILTATAVVMSYRWANDLVYKATGSPVPVQQGPGNPGLPVAAAAKPEPSASPAPASKPATRPLNTDALFAAAEKLSPGWETLTLRLGNARGGNGGAPRPAGEVRPPAEMRPADARLREGQARPAPQPVVFIVREPASSPRFATTTLTLDPFTGEPLKRETFADSSLGRRARSWNRFLHTGEAFGWPGQLIAALASLGACFLVYTGFALSWRRFFMKKEPKSEPVVSAP